VRLARRSFVAGGCALCALSTIACTPTDGSSRPATGIDGKSDLAPRTAPGVRTAVSAEDDDGLRGLTEKIEQNVRSSRSLVRDPSVNAYLRDLVRRLAGDFADDIRPYLLRVPDFNASQYPNGMMQVWTGLLLRCTNEAQLAAVLGHEIGHYQRAHGVERLRNARQTADMSQILAMIFGAAGAARASDLTAFMLLASNFSYSRDHEREADEIGVRQVSRIGLDPAEAAQNWDNVMSELTALGVDRGKSVVFSTHPATEERTATLRSRARELPAGDKRADAYRRGIESIRPALFEEQMQKGQPAAMLVIAERWLAVDAADGLARYAKGEAHRLRDAKGDEDAAIEALAAAFDQPGTPPSAWRSLATIRRKRGERTESDALFREYLRRVPNAPDRDLIRRILTS
jgi:predicted Zn-dependent protease